MQWPKPAVSLFCTAALSRGQLPKAVWHCTAVAKRSLHTCTDSKSPCTAALSRGQSFKSSMALHCCCHCTPVQQISIGVFAVAQACCQPVLHSSTEQGAIAKSSVALHCCWVTAHLYQQQISLGVFAVAQACCQLVLHSSTEQGAIAKSSVALHCY